MGSVRPSLKTCAVATHALCLMVIPGLHPFSSFRMFRHTLPDGYTFGSVHKGVCDTKATTRTETKTKRTEEICGEGGLGALAGVVLGSVACRPGVRLVAGVCARPCLPQLSQGMAHLREAQHHRVPASLPRRAPGYTGPSRKRGEAAGRGAVRKGKKQHTQQTSVSRTSCPGSGSSTSAGPSRRWAASPGWPQSRTGGPAPPHNA